MSRLSKIIGMAKKALDENGSSPSAGSRSGAADWKSIVRGAADTLTGDGRTAAPHASAHRRPPGGPADAADRAAVARYDYLLQTADPHQIERVHREAFARLTPVQRAQIEVRMQSELPPHERPRSAEAPDLARAAARAEAGRPGLLRGLLARAEGRRGRSGTGGAVAGAGLAAGGVLAAVAGGAVVSSVAGPLLEQAAGFGIDFDALAAGIDLGGVEDLAAGAGDIASGFGDRVSGVGEHISGFEVPGLGDLFGR